MGGIKRAPALASAELRFRAHDIPKSEWVELYRDLYRQMFGEEVLDEEVIKDAERRREILFDKRPKPRWRKESITHEPGSSNWGN